MRNRFQHILLPVDFTQKNRGALEITFELAVENQTRVTLLHVIETIEAAGEPDDELREFYARLEQRAGSELESMMQRFEETKVNVEAKIRIGRRAQEILQFAEEHDVDLIVLSSHPIDREQPIESLGTISYQVSVLCRCPVLLVK